MRLKERGATQAASVVLGLVFELLLDPVLILLDKLPDDIRQSGGLEVTSIVKVARATFFTTGLVRQVLHTQRLPVFNGKCA